MATRTGDKDSLRGKAIDAVRALKRENEPRIGDTYWTSYTGYNYGRWADKGFGIALNLLRQTLPQPGESETASLRRVVEMLRVRRDEYRNDDEDEDGACSGAIDAAIWAIVDLLPPQTGHTGNDAPARQEPAAEAPWEVWYQDTFDRETPPTIEVRGQGLVPGLKELWARWLFETVRPDGQLGFSRFHLAWEPGTIRIEGDKKGAARLRKWVFGLQEQAERGYLEAGDKRLLTVLAQSHALLIQDMKSSEQILAQAAEAANIDDFLARLKRLTV